MEKTDRLDKSEVAFIRRAMAHAGKDATNRKTYSKYRRAYRDMRKLARQYVSAEDSRMLAANHLFFDGPRS
jgi:hypothetical protein